MEQKQPPVDLRVNYIPVKASLNWDEYFMLQAMLASFRSKDPNTKVGCVFVDRNNHQITMGYNGAIAGINEAEIPWGNDRSVPLEFQKYGYVIHSEANAIAHSKGNLEGARGYVTHFPCNECAKLIASHRVKEIVYLSDKHLGSPENSISKRIFDLAGISHRQLNIRPELLGELHNYLGEMIRDAVPTNLASR